MTTADEPQEHANPVVDRLQIPLAESERAGEPVGLLLVHAAAIDRIDALHGFHAGDRMSAMVSHLLRLLPSSIRLCQICQWAYFTIRFPSIR